MTKCKGGCQMKAGGKTCAKCGCDMDSKKEKYEDDDDMKSGGRACMKCGGKMHKSGGTISSCMKCGGGKYTFGGKTGWSKKKNDVSKYKNGGYIQAQAGWNGEAFDPIYVSNQNDPRLKSYQDSTALYNNYMNNYNVIKSGGKYNNTVETTKPAIYSISETWKDINPNNKLTYKKADDFGFHVIDKNGYPELTFMSNKKIQPIATETFTRKESKYPSEKKFDEYAKKIKSQGGTFSEKPNEANWVGYELQKYKKPVQPIVYKKPDIRVPEMSVEETTKMMDNLAKDRKEKEDYAAYEKWISENPLAEPEPRVNEEMEINPWKIINMPTKSPEFIQRNEMLPNINTGIKYQKESGEGAYPMMMSNEGQGTVNKKGKRKYQAGGLASISADKEIALSSGAFNVAEPTYDASVISNEKPMYYKEAVQSFRKKEVDKTLPNFGYAKQEQIKLNELIRKDISTGNAKMDLLSEDDIIGEKTLGAMRAYEASGQYTRPEGFKDKWLAEYKKQWDEMQATGKAPKGPAPKATVEQPKKEEEKTLVDNIYDYFKPSKKQQAVKETPKKPTSVNKKGYKMSYDKEGFPVVTIPDEDLPYDESGKYTDNFVKKEKKSKKGSFFPSASDMMSGLQGSVDYAGNALSSFIGNTADFVKNNQNKTTDNKKYSVKSRAASVSAEKISQKKSGVTVLRKYDSSGPSYTKSKIVVKDNITNKTHTVTIPQMFDKAKGKYHTIEIAGKKHKIFLDPNLK